MITRVNMSIDSEVLAAIDEAARKEGQSRSEFVQWLFDKYELNKEYARELAAGIEEQPSYEKRREAKADAFYMLYGFLGA